MSQIANSQTVNPPDQFQDALYKEAQNVLKNQLNGENKPSKISLYISFCTYNISNPSKIITIGQKLHKDSIQANTFLNALYFVSLRYMSHPSKIKAIEIIYQKLMEINQVRKILLQTCNIPTQLRPLLEKEKTKGKLTKGSQEQRQVETAQVVDFQVASNKSRKGIIKMVLLLGQIDHSSTQNDFNSMWDKMLVIIGEFEIHLIQLLDVVIQSLIPSKKYEFSIFCFKKLAETASPQVILSHLMLKEEKVMNSSPKQNQSSLATSLQRLSINGLPLDSNITALALLVKAKIINEKQIFLKLQPQSFHKLYDLDPKNEELSNGNKNIKEYKGDRKQQFLTQLILLNALDIFKKLVTQFKIKVQFLNYVPLYYAMSELLQWMIDPVFKAISFSHLFPPPRQSKPQNRTFMAGSIRQLSVIDRSFTQIHNLIQIRGVANIFARRSTYIKICRLFTAIFKRHQKLTLVEQDKPEFHGLIYDYLYQYLLPSIQYYNQDSSILAALNTLLQELPIRYQHIALLKSVQKKQYQPNQLIQNTLQTCQQLKILLNKISNSNLHIIQAKIKQYVYSRPFCSLLELLNRLLIGGTTCIMKSIIKIVSSSPILIKKIFTIYVMNHLFQREESLVLKNSQFSPSFNILIDLINDYLVQDKESTMLIAFLISYIVNKFKPHSKPVVDMTNYQFFNSQIGLLSNILQFLLPIQIAESSNAQHQNKYNSINGAGICLKVNFLQTIQKFMKCKDARQKLAYCFINNTNPFQTNFYKILVLMYQLRQKIYLSSDYNLSHVVYYIDQINSLTYILIQLINLEVNTQLKNIHFSFDLFDQLLNKYKLPLQICFALLRKNLFEKYSLNEETSFFCQEDWQTIKQNYYKAIDKHLQQKSYIDQVQLKNLSATSFSKLEIQSIMKNDLYLLFWILPNEIAENRNKQYIKTIKSIEKELKQSQMNLQPNLRYKQAFLQELKKERSSNLKLKQVTLFLNSPLIRQFYVFKKKQQFLDDLHIFIKKCVISRALLSKSDAFYSWSFLLNVIRQNQKGPIFLFQVISLLREEISKMLVLQTPRQASLFLPFLANLPNYFTQNYYDLQLLDQRLRTNQILTRKLSKKEHKQIINIIKESSTNIINNLVVQYSRINQCSLKNVIEFICVCKFVPMFSDQATLIYDFLDQIKKTDKYGIDNTKIQITIKIIAERQKKIQSKSHFLGENLKDSHTQRLISNERKIVTVAHQKQDKYSDLGSCSSETKSSYKPKLKSNPLTKDVKDIVKEESCKQMDLFSEDNEQKNQMTENITYDRKAQKETNPNEEKNIRLRPKIQHKKIQCIQILDDE